MWCCSGGFIYKEEVFIWYIEPGGYIFYTHTFIYGIFSHVFGQLYKETDYCLGDKMCDSLNTELSIRFRRTNHKKKCPGREEDLEECRTQSHCKNILQRRLWSKVSHLKSNNYWVQVYECIHNFNKSIFSGIIRMG